MTFTPVPSSLMEGLFFYDSYILLGHEQPDADSLCSQLGLAALLEKKGKRVHLLAAKPFTRPETLEMESRFTTEWDFTPDGKTLLVLLDLSDPARTGFPLEELEKFPRMVIDHHASGRDEGLYRYVVPQSPSTTLLVQKIWEEAGMSLDKEISSLLFFGFATDTGFFRHLEDNTGEVFDAVSRLIRQGASPNRTYRQISAGRKLSTRRLMGRILERSRFYCSNRIIISWEDARDREELGTDERDSDKLYQLLQSIDGCEAVALLRMEDDKHCIVGLRSNNQVDVGKIASILGGGGHKKASGCSVEGNMDEVREKVLALFEEQL